MRFLALSALLVLANACTIHVVEEPAVPVAVQPERVLVVAAPAPAEQWPAPVVARPPAEPRVARSTPATARPTTGATTPVRTQPRASLTNRPDLMATPAAPRPQKPFPRRFKDTTPEPRRPQVTRVAAQPTNAERPVLVSLRDVTRSRSTSVAKAQ